MKAVACYQDVKIQPAILENVCVNMYRDFLKFALFLVQVRMVIGYLKVQLLRHCSAV